MILQKYIAKEVVKAFLLILIVLFAIIIITGPFFKFYKQYEAVGAEFLADILPYFIPQVLGFIIPLAIMIASVFVFGRLSEDNEIMAIRSSGIFLGRIIWPVVFFGLLLSMLIVWFNIHVIPSALNGTRIVTVDTIKNNIVSPSLINRSLKLSQKYQIYYNDIKDNTLYDVSIAQLDKNGNLYEHIKAEEGKLDFDEETSQMILSLKKVTEIIWEGEKGKKEPRVLPNLGSMQSVLDLSRRLLPKSKNLSAMSLNELDKLIEKNQTERFRMSEILVEKHRRFAFGFTPLLFLLIGMPVGIIVHKGSKVAGLGISALIVFAGYYPLTILFTRLGEKNFIMPQFAVWLPNAVILAGAAVLTYIILRK
ncbi:MAG: LptF/LptG family permease [Planctomycetes bacterium]|nr:LptF/LptG family permease [Planctomycetota bacterium]